MKRSVWFPSLPTLFGPRRSTPVQRRSLLRLIAIAAEERVALPPLLDAWANDESGRQRGRLRRLATLLREGVALPDAVERLPGVLDDESSLLVRFASESGALAPSIRRFLDARGPLDSLLRENVRRSLGYLAMLVFIGMPIAAFIRFAIYPSIDQIFNEFGLERAAMTQVADAVGGLAWGAWLLAAVVVFGFVWGRAFSWPGRWVRQAVAPRLFAPIRRQRIAAVLARLGDSAAAGRPLAGAISTLARHHYDPWLRNKLLFVRNEIALGAEAWPALRDAGLLTDREATALETADRVETRGWALATLAGARRQRTVRRLTLQSALLLPAIVLVFAAFVVTQSVGVFGALVQLIEACS